MSYGYWVALGLLVLLTPLRSPLRGSDPPSAEVPCEPGYRWVEETTYKEEVREVCKLVPGTKKVRKIVYSTKEEPYCQRWCGLKGLLGKKGCGEEGCQGKCPKCKGPYRRTILVKTEIVTEEPIMKCVTEKEVVRVPCKVRRKVPCEATPPPQSASGPSRDR